MPQQFSSAFVLSPLDYCNSFLYACPQYLLNKLHSQKQHCLLFPVNSPNRPHLSSCLSSPLIMNTVQSHFSELQLPQLYCSPFIWLNSSMVKSQPASYTLLLTLLILMCYIYIIYECIRLTSNLARCVLFLFFRVYVNIYIDTYTDRYSLFCCFPLLIY